MVISITISNKVRSNSISKRSTSSVIFFQFNLKMATMKKIASKKTAMRSPNQKPGKDNMSKFLIVEMYSHFCYSTLVTITEQTSNM